MDNKKLKRLNLFRWLSYAYLILICLYWLIDNGFPEHINWPILITGILLLMQIFIKVPLVDGVLGFILGLLSIYMVIAVTGDLIKHLNGTRIVPTFGIYFGYGYSVFTLTMLCAITIIYAHIAKQKILENNRKLQTVQN